MDGRVGGCCIARYGGGDGGACAYTDMSKVDRIMLRYRPIAPKPVVAGGVGGAVSGGSTPEIKDSQLKSGRPKRKYVRDSSKKCGMRKTKFSPEKTSSGGSGGSSSGGETVVTLPLLSEMSERKEYSPVQKAPIWLNFDRKEIVSGEEDREYVAFGGGRREKTVAQAARLVGSCVTVECVTDTCVDGNGLGSTDEEKVMSLERDTCPGFVSDGYNRVRWTNKAYREMVQVDGEEEMMVWLVLKDLVLLPVMTSSFTCRVRVTCRKDRGCALTLPCDAWRLDNGGFAWRLDVKAALCLGR